MNEEELEVADNFTIFIGDQCSRHTLGLRAQSRNAREIRRSIAQKAYELYEKRGRGHGLALEDWLEAERIVLGCPECSDEPSAAVGQNDCGKSGEKRIQVVHAVK